MISVLHKFFEGKANVLVIFAYEGGQKMPLPSMPFWHKDHFELKAIKKRRTQEDLSALPLSV